MKKIKNFNKASIFFLVSILSIGMWYYLSNPASILKDKKINEIGIYSSSNKTLWELGYNSKDFTKASPQFGDFEFNAVFKGEALNKVIESLEYPSKSYYLLPPKVKDVQGLYYFDIQISNEEGFIFITKDLNAESKGRFVGYKYKGKENSGKKWILYENPKLGQTLEKLRSKKNSSL